MGAVAPHVVSAKDLAAVYPLASNDGSARLQRGVRFLRDKPGTVITILEVNAKVGAMCAVAGAVVGAAGGALVGGAPTALALGAEGAVWGFGIGFLAGTTYELVNLGTSPEYLEWLALQREQKVIPVYRKFGEGAEGFQTCPLTGDFIRYPVLCSCHEKPVELGAIREEAARAEAAIAEKNRQLEAAGKTAIYTTERCFVCPHDHDAREHARSNPLHVQAEKLVGLGNYTRYGANYHDGLFKRLKERSAQNPQVAEACKVFSNAVIRSEVEIAQQELAQMAAADDADPENLIKIGADMVRNIVRRRSVL